MKAALSAFAVVAAVAATSALAAEDEHSGRRASAAAKPLWEFAITAYPTVVRGGENYTSAIAVADRGPLHLEASVAWKQFDFYIEAEYVRDSNQRTDSYFYAWSELGFRPVDWLRVGIAGQRTRTYSNERDIQRGAFAQVTWGPVTIGGYWFNPGSIDRVFVGMIGATF